MGYRPVWLNGTLVDPTGSCSSPVTLPAEFDAACKAHDLGYDLLRYADRVGAPLRPWARMSVDAALERRMQAECRRRAGVEARWGCYTMAGMATMTVDANSWRQDYRSPVVEPVLEFLGRHLLATALGAVLLIAGPAAAAALVHRRLFPVRVR